MIHSNAKTSSFLRFESSILKRVNAVENKQKLIVPIHSVPVDKNLIRSIMYGLETVFIAISICLGKIQAYYGQVAKEVLNFNVYLAIISSTRAI